MGPAGCLVAQLHSSLCLSTWAVRLPGGVELFQFPHAAAPKSPVTSWVGPRGHTRKLVHAVPHPAFKKHAQIHRHTGRQRQRLRGHTALKRFTHTHTHGHIHIHIGEKQGAGSPGSKGEPGPGEWAESWGVSG